MQARNGKSRAVGPAASKATQGGAWRRKEDELDATGRLGHRLRQLREGRAMSLSAASRATGIPAATLSRIENNKMSPTFGMLFKITEGLELDWPTLMSPDPALVENEVSYAHAAQGEIADFPGMRYRRIHADRTRALTVTFLDVTAMRPEEFGGLTGHTGVEFCYVIRGTMELLIEGRPSRKLRQGDSALFDSSIPHGYLACNKRGASLLIVSTGGGAAKAQTVRAQMAAKKRPGQK